jgi:hypothetical protein
MRLATSEPFNPSTEAGTLSVRLARLDYDHPDDILEDPSLARDEKRALLCSWASDASAVRDEPELRWLLGTPAPVRLDEILNALLRLDGELGR